MKPVDQTIFGIGKGNCFAACLASLMELSIEEVVHFPDGCCFNWRDIVNSWLVDYGLFFIEVTVPSDARSELVKYWGFNIIMGDSPRPDRRHAVVGLQDKIEHDPHPSRDGLLGCPDDWTFGFLVPVNVGAKIIN